MRRTRADAITIGAILHGGDQPWMVREPEIIVTAKMQLLTPIDGQSWALRRVDDPTAAKQALGLACGKRLRELV